MTANDTTEAIKSLKVGDRCLMKKFVSGAYIPIGVRTVSRLTPTQIILAPEGVYDRYHRIGGVRKYPGKNINVNGACIEREATPEEIEHWDSEKRKKEESIAAAKAERTAYERKRGDLNGIFSESVIVRGSHHAGTWEVEFGPLTEDQVRKLAELVRGAL